MNIMQRATRSIIRKPIKYLLLFLIVLVIASFLMAALACAGASVTSQNTAKQAMGTAYRLEINAADNMKRSIAEIESVQLPNGAWLMQAPNNQFDSLLLNDIEKIAAVEGVDTYDITTRQTPVKPVNFKRIEDANRDQNMDFKGVNLIGCHDMSLNVNVTGGNVSLKEGRLIAADDENKIVISEQLAQLNGLSIGNMLSFCPVREKDGTEVHQAEIIGIFTLHHDIPSMMDGDTFRPENAIFADLRFPEKAEGHADDPFLANAEFHVNADRYDEIGERIRAVDIGWQRYNLVDNNGMFEQVSDNFNNMGGISRMLIIIVCCASLLILLFVLLFWIRGRSREIGIFMSLGISKLKILSQFLNEALIVGILAFALSFIVSPVVSEQAADYIAKGQQQEMEQKALELEGTIRSSGNIDRGKDEMMDVSIEITPMMAAGTGGLVVLLVSGAVLLSSVTVMRKSTVNILSDI